MQTFTVQFLSQHFSDHTKWPEFVSILWPTDEEVILNLNVPLKLEYFSGHFPEQAVLPGVVQVHWAGIMAQNIFHLDKFQSLRNVKFKNMLFPGMQVELCLKYQKEKAILDFLYSSSGEDISSGRLMFCGVNEKQV